MQQQPQGGQQGQLQHWQQQPQQVQQPQQGLQQQQQQGLQQQQQQGQQQQPHGQTALGSDQQKKPEDKAQQPGFFGRLFRRKPATPPAGTDGTAAAGAGGAQDPNAPQQPGGPPVVEAPKSAAWCASKELPPEAADKLRHTPVAPSRYKCLQTPAQAAAVAAGAVPGAPGWDPNAPAGQRPTGITSTPMTGPPPDIQVYGPYLRFGGYDPASHAFYVSVLVISHQSRGVKEPLLKFRDVHVPRSETSAKAQHLQHYMGFNWWRFDLTILCGIPERTVEYAVVHEKDHVFTQQNRHCFFVPGIAQDWRWGFYSCNGFHSPAHEAQLGGIQPMWRDVLHCHEQRPMHVMLGGGDQIYNDELWNLPALVQWLHIPDRFQRLHHPFTQEMADQVEHFLFLNYLKHWGEPLFADAMATIPQAMVWDDHDIFEGWGSFPVELHWCPVFQGIFHLARKLYFLFQQHSTMERINDENKVFGELGYHWIGCLGASTAVVLLDTRTERSRGGVVRPGSWAQVQQRLAALPPTVRHVVVVSPAPLVFPQLQVVSSSLNFMPGQGRLTSSVVAMTQKSGLSSLLYTSLGEIEVLDDLQDQWGSRAHAEEKLAALHMLQDMAMARAFRFSFLSGSARVVGVGRVVSHPQAGLRSDHRFMPQIICGAIGNRPAPGGVVKALAAVAKPRMLDEHCKELMLKVFDGNKPFKAVRSWCVVSERQLGMEGPALDGSLTFQFRKERLPGSSQRPESVDVSVPLLLVAQGFSINKLQPFALAAPPPLPLPGPDGPPVHIGPDGRPVQYGLDGRPVQYGPDGKPLKPQQHGLDGRPLQYGPDGKPLQPQQLGPEGRPLQYGPDGRPLQQQLGPDGRPLQQQQFGPDGRPLQQQQFGPDGRPLQQQFGPDGRPLQQQFGPDGRPLQQQFGADGRPLQHYGPDGGPLSGGQYGPDGKPVQQQYGLDGRQLQQYGPDGRPAQQQYGPDGRPVQQQYGPDGRLLSGGGQQYGPDGRPVQQQYGPDGRPLPLQFGPGGRPLPQQYGPDGKPLQQYGPDGRPLQQYGPDGRPLSGGQQQFGPDGRPRSLSGMQGQFGPGGRPQFGPDGRPVQQQYGPDGRPVQQQYGPDGRPVQQQYGPDGRPVQQQYGPDGRPLQQQYGPDGRPLQQGQFGPNGRPLQQQYGPDGRPLQQQYGPDGRPLQQGQFGSLAGQQAGGFGGQMGPGFNAQQQQGNNAINNQVSLQQGVSMTKAGGGGQQLWPPQQQQWPPQQQGGASWQGGAQQGGSYGSQQQQGSLGGSQGGYPGQNAQSGLSPQQGSQGGYYSGPQTPPQQQQQQQQQDVWYLRTQNQGGAQDARARNMAAPPDSFSFQQQQVGPGVGQPQGWSAPSPPQQQQQQQQQQFYPTTPGRW